MKELSNYIKQGIFDIDANIESNRPMEEEFEEWCRDYDLRIIKKLNNGLYNLKNISVYNAIHVAPPHPFINKIDSVGRNNIMLYWTEDEFKKFMPKQLAGNITIKCDDAKDLDWLNPDLKIAGNFAIYDCKQLERVSNDFGEILPVQRGNPELRIENCPNLKSVDGMRVVAKNGYVTFHKCPKLRNLKWKQLIADWINFDYCGFDGLDNICNYGPCTGKLSVYE